MNPHSTRPYQSLHARPETYDAPLVAPIRMLRISEVLALTGLSRTKIYELQTQGDFPMRVQLTSRRVAWVEAEVQAWLSARVKSNTPLIVR